MRSRKVAIAVAAAILLAVIVVGGGQVAQALGPHISQKDATVEAVRQLQQMDPSVTGYTLVTARYDPEPDRIHDDRGNLISSESHSACRIARFQGPRWLCRPDAAWIFHFRAPAQGGYSSNEAYVVVNATNESVGSASLSRIN